MIQKLTAADVRKACDPALFNNTVSATSTTNDVIIGQQRAIKALKLGLGMKSPGFNIYVSGADGTGKLTVVNSYVAQQAKNEAIPCDWCYVNNFKDTYRPDKLSMPAGYAVRFKKELKKLISDCYSALVKVFESDDFADKKGNVIRVFEEQQAKILGSISEHAEKESFRIQQTPSSIITVPLRDDKPISEEQFQAMTPAEIEKLNATQKILQEEISLGIREIRKIEKAADEQLDTLTKEVAQYAIGHLIEEVADAYSSIPNVAQYLQLLRDDIMDNLPEFMKSQKSNNAVAAAENPFLKRYEVTILVDNGALTGAPVIIERNPTYNNLLGRVEKESNMGTLYTDFTMIRQGSLHTANGGYLIIRIEEILKNYFAWDCLKRALKNREVVIEEATDQLGYLTTRSLKPEPIPMNVKVILVGNGQLYQMLYEYDNDFKELFKIKADFDDQMPNTPENIADYAAFARSICNKESLLPIDNTGIAKIVEYGSRLVQHQDKLSTRFGAISDILREANYYALENTAGSITETYIKQAIAEKFSRSNLIQEKLAEMIRTEQIFIDTDGEKVGQINALSVLELGDIAFGIPARITCSISMGKAGVVAIEREAELSGPLHTKGVLILTGYLASKFIQEKPAALSIRLVFEQSYGMVDGDSASSTELYAILSTIANIPIRQGIAVTGSVNQKGEIQPIGGINEKIEGYFEICKYFGFTGAQGVMVPSSNIKNMMLKEEVTEAMERGEFSIWAVDTIEDGIEVLTGVKAGSIWEDGTVFYDVLNGIDMYADRLKQYAANEGDDAEG